MAWAVPCALFLVPVASLWGPQALVLFLGGSVLGACFYVFGGGARFVSTGAWLIYIRGIVVIFLFFAWSAPNLPRPSLGGGGILLTAVAVLVAGPSCPLITSPPTRALAGAVVGGGGAGTILWLGGTLFLVLVVIQGEAF